MIIIIYTTCDGLDAQASLPDGVIELETTNWVKTREPDEIGEGEKKLNSHVDLSEFNKNISAEDVETIDGLYDEKYNLRPISSLPENNGEISGNKVLRTVALSNDTSVLRYDIDNLYSYLKSDSAINWQNDGGVTWNLYTEVNDTKSSVEWRMLSAKFNISEEQKKLIDSKNVQVLLGVPADNKYGFELIVPYSDIMSVFVNKKTTSVNCINNSKQNSYYLNDTLIKYKSTLECCDENYHKKLSNYTDGYHVDTNLADFEIANKVFKSGENTIDILIGNFITNENSLNNVYGFSKINLYIIEKPKININLKFYKYVNEEIVYFDENYLPKKGEKVYLRIDVENKSDKVAINNLDLTLKINSKLPITINSNNVFYNNQDITSKTRCYLNEDFSEVVDQVSNLNPNEKITIMSEAIDYTITHENCIENYVFIESVASMNYIRDNLTYTETKNKYYLWGSVKDNRLRIPVSNNVGSLNIGCSVENSAQDTNFMLNISSSEDFANLLIKPGQTYKIDNLRLSDYDINLILPQDYEIVDTDTYSSSNHNTINLNSTNYEKNIQIKLKKKNNLYFYKNDENKVTISVLKEV